MAKKKTTADKQIAKAIISAAPKNIGEVNNLFRTGSTSGKIKEKESVVKAKSLPVRKSSSGDIEIQASDKVIADFIKSEENKVGAEKKQNTIDEYKRAKTREENIVRQRFGSGVRNEETALKPSMQNAFKMAGQMYARKNSRQTSSPYYGKSFTELTNLRSGIDARLHSGKITQAQAEKEKNTIDMWRVQAASKSELSEMLRKAEEYKKYYSGLYNEAQKVVGYSRGNIVLEKEAAEHQKRLTDTKGKLDNIETLIGQIKSQQGEYEVMQSYDNNLVKWGKVALESGVSDEYVPTEKKNTDYDIINALRADKSGVNILSNDKDKKFSLLTDGEVRLYNTLYNNNPDDAESYLKSLDDILNRRLSEYNAEKISERAEKHPIAMGGYSVASNLIAGLPAAVDNVIENITGDIDTYDTTSQMLRTSQAAREGGAQHFTEKYGEKGGFAYNTVLSMVDNLANVLLFKGAGKTASALVSANMATSAASNAMISAADRGGNDKQILLSGVTSGLAEYLFEKISIDKLFKIKGAGDWKTFLKQLGVQAKGQMITEAKEELFTEIANIFSDAIIMQGQSENARKRREYVMQGMSAEEATKKVMQESIVQVAMATAAGALSGGVMGAGAGVVNKISRSSHMTSVGERLIKNPERLNRILQIGVENSNAEALKMRNAEYGVRNEEFNPDLTEEDLSEYMKTGKSLHTRNKKQRMLEAGKKPILTTQKDVRSFISDIIHGKAQGEVRAFKKVGKKLAEAILKKRSTLDAFGKYLELNADDLREAYKRHSSPKERGDIPLSEQDFENIPEYLDKFDGVLSVNTYNNKVEVHIYKETEDGYVKILTVASNERNSLQVTKLIGISKEKFIEKYAKKIEGRTGSPQSQNKDPNPSTTARRTADAPSNTMIAQDEDSVKGGNTIPQSPDGDNGQSGTPVPTTQRSPLTARQAGKMAESIITDALTKKGDIASIARIIGALEGRDPNYIGSQESFDTARAVMRFVNESATKEDTALLERSSGAITVLTAIEGDAKAWESVKTAAVKDAEYQTQRKAESSGIDVEKPVEEYPYDVKKVITDYVNSTNKKLVDFAKKVLGDKNTPQNEKYYFEGVTERAAKDIESIIGIDARGFKSAIEARMIWHINKDHGSNGAADQSMSNIEDIGRMEYVLNNYDDITYGGTTEAYSTVKENGRAKLADTVVYTKKINGTYYVVQAVPNTKAKTLFVVSAYINKKGAAQLTDTKNAPVFTSENGSVVAPEGITQALRDEKSSLGTTSETPLASLPSDNIVSQDESGVKRGKSFDIKKKNPKTVSSKERTTIRQGSSSNDSISETNSAVNINNMQISSENTQYKRIGLVMNEAAAELDQGVRANIQTFAERTGSTVIVEHGLVDENGEAIMGEEKDGVIRINADYADAAHSITVHEFTHRMQSIAPKASEKFRDYVVSKMVNEGTYEGAMAKLREDYQGLSDEKLIDELCAETAERLFRDEAELTDFIKKDRTLAEWVKDVWLNVLDMLGRTDERTHAQLMWKRCVKEAAKAKDKDVNTGEVRYKKEYSFNKQVDDALGNKIQRGYSVYVGKLPKLLEKCGLNPNLPMLMHPSHIRDINHEKSPENIHYHGISSEIIKQIPELIKYPAMIYDSISEDNSANSICILTTQCNNDGAPIVIVITNSEQNGKYLDVKMETKKTDASNHVDTMYGKDGFSYHIDSVIEKDAILYISKDGLNKLLNRKNLRLNSDGKLRLLARLDNLRFDTIIHQSRNVVNTYSMQKPADNSTNSKKRPGVSEKLDEYIKDFGEMKKGAEPRRDVSVPMRTEKDNKVRQFARTAAESLSLSEDFSDDVLESIAEEKMSYTPKSDREALNYAYSQLEIMGSEWAAQKVNGAIAAHSLDKDTVALSEVLLQHYDDEGMRKEAQELIVKFAAEGTRMGQSIQAISMLKKLSRDYELVFVDKIIENLQEDIIKKSKARAMPKIEISEELRQELTNAKSEEERTDALEKIYTEIAGQLPKSWIDRWNEWRYFSMLANARTHVRNVLGNAFFMPMIASKNVAAKIAEGIGTTVSGGKMERSKTFFVGKEYRDFAKQDVIDMRAELTGGGKHNPSDIIKDKQKLFPKGIDWLMTGNEKLMEYEDWIFLKHHYKVALRNYLAANKVNLDNIDAATLEKARYRALTEAQRNTYRDLSEFAKVLNEASKKNKGMALLVEGLMPFKKTPINVLKRGVSYSPAGLVKVMFKDISKISSGDMTASEWIDSLAQGLTGCGVVALGMLLTSLGYIEGAFGDEKEKEFEELQGMQNYSLVIGEHSYTLDWLAPFSLPFFVGVEIMKLVKRDEKLEPRAAFEAVLNLAEPMLEMSMLSGLTDAITTTQNASDAQKVMEMTIGVLKNYIGQGIPTLFGQIARVIDDTRRTVYDDKNSAVPGVIQRAGQTMVRKIPGATKTLQPYVDRWGRKEVTDGVFKRALINMLSPGYYSKIETSDMEEELKRLYDEVGEEDGMSLFPSKAVNKFTLDDDTEKNLTAEEYTVMQETQGQSAYNMLTDIVGDAVYEKLDDMVRGKLVTNVYKLSRAKAKKAVAGNEWTPGDKWIKTALTLIDGEDYSAAEDFLVYHTLKNLDETSAEKEARSFAFENLDDIPSEYWESSLSESAAKRYNEFIKDSNIDIEEFISIQDYKGGLKTINKDTPNEITPQEQMIEYLDDLDLSTDDYRRVWQALDYSLKKCPR